MRNQTSYLCTSFVQAKRNQRLLLLDIIKTFSSKYSHSGNNQYLQQIEYPLKSNETFKNESMNMFSDSLIGDINNNILYEWKNLNELVLSGNLISDSSFFILCDSLSKMKAPNLKNLFINRILYFVFIFTLIIVYIDCGLSSICGTFLSQFIISKSFDNVEILELTGNNLQSDGIEIIGASFLVREKCNLITFDVNNNNNDGNGIIPFLTAISQSKLPNIKNLNVSGSLNEIKCWEILDIILQSEADAKIETLNMSSILPINFYFIFIY